jgi:hypothetical protein
MIEYIFIAVLITTNIFSILYCRFLLKNLVELSESIKDVRALIDGFRGHVDSLHELEMFYGDETLKSMIDHAKFVVEQIDTYKETLSLTSQEEGKDGEEETEETLLY